MLKSSFLSVVVGIFGLVVAVFASPAFGADWPGFRGPRGSGIAASGETAPTVWGPDTNIRWKAAMARPGNGSPIVVAGRVLVTSAQDEKGLKRSLYCIDAKSGRQLWVRTVELDRVMPTHKTNPYCGSTPVSDGERVVVWEASAGLHCYDLNGKPLWSRDLGEFRHLWGYGSSPILYEGKVILHTGPGKRSFVTAINLNEGKTLWETDEPQEGSEKNKQGKIMGSWSTPMIARVGAADQIILTQPLRVVAYDPVSGRIIWSCDGMRHAGGDLAYSSPTIVGDLCFVTGGFRGVSMAIRLGGSGNITDTHRLYRIEKNPQSIGSGVPVDGYVYRPGTEPALLDCVDPRTGRVLWSQRVEGVALWASVVKAGEFLYATGQDMTVVVYRPSTKGFEPVAVNRLTGSCNATPAVAHGCLYIRANEWLYCIGKK